MTRSTLSCCLITRDNARSLEMCLDSVAPLVDEIVIVDGGSTDGTLEIAARYGHARIFTSEFVDFSSQRNVYLEKARGDWLLVLDADEVLGASASEELLGRLESDHHTHYWLPRYWLASCAPPCYIESDLTYPDHQLRVFRRLPDLEYENAVHQSLELEGPCGFLLSPHLFHLHYLLNDRAAREQRLADYENLAPGSGRGLYRRYYVPEERSHRVRPCLESPAVPLDGEAAAPLPSADRSGESSTPALEDLLERKLKDVLPHLQARILERTSYFGIPTLKCPLDFWVYQELLHERQPDVIVEIGTAWGGSALALAHCCDRLGKGRVLSVDLDQSRVDDVVRRHPRIELLEGDAVGKFPDVQRRVGAEAEVLVIEDSSHECRQTLEVLRTYSPLVRSGGWFVVEDGICHHGLAQGPYPGPWEAVETFLRESPSFEADRSREFPISWNPRGYLRRSR